MSSGKLTKDDGRRYCIRAASLEWGRAAFGCRVADVDSSTATKDHYGADFKSAGIALEVGNRAFKVGGTIGYGAARNEHHRK